MFANILIDHNQFFPIKYIYIYIGHKKILPYIVENVRMLTKTV